MSKTTPTQRSLALLRAEGRTVQVVERWNPHARVRQDFLGFADLLCIRPGEPGVLAVQTTSASNQAARLTKIIETPAAALWLGAGCRIEIHGWSRRGAKGKRKLWDVTRREVTVEDLKDGQQDDDISHPIRG